MKHNRILRRDHVVSSSPVCVCVPQRPKRPGAGFNCLGTGGGKIDICKGSRRFRIAANAAANLSKAETCLESLSTIQSLMPER